MNVNTLCALQKTNNKEVFYILLENVFFYVSL